MSIAAPLWTEFWVTAGPGVVTFLILFIVRNYIMRPQPFLSSASQFTQLTHLPEGERERILSNAARKLSRSVFGMVPMLVWVCCIAIGTLWRPLKEMGMFPNVYWLGIGFATTFALAGLFVARAIEKVMLDSRIAASFQERSAGGS